MKEPAIRTSKAPAGKDVGLETIEYLIEIAGIEPCRLVREERGFTWWAGDLAQRLWAEPTQTLRGEDNTRIHIETAFLKDVPNTAYTAVAVSLANKSGVLSALVWDPGRGTIRVQATISMLNWTLEALQEIAARVMLAQVSEAECRVEKLAAAFEARPDTSAHPVNSAAKEPHASVATLQYLAKCAGSTPPISFEELANMEPRLWVLATADADGLTAEVPFFGSTPAAAVGDGPVETALLRAYRTNHCFVNGGVAVRLALPCGGNAETANRLNALEATDYTGPLQLGAWRFGEDDGLCCSVFVPAVLATSDFITWLVLQMACRARWTRQLLFPPEPFDLNYTDVLAFVGSALQCSDKASVAELHDLDELCAFARAHDTLADAWDRCHRVDWMLWLLEKSHQLHMVSPFDIGSLVERFRMTLPPTSCASLAAAQCMADRLREEIRNPFLQKDVRLTPAMAGPRCLSID